MTLHSNDAEVNEDSSLLQQAELIDKPSVFLWIAILATSCGTFAFGYCLGFTSPVFNPSSDMTKTYYLDTKFFMTDDQKTWFGSVINLGACLGGVLGGFPVDKFGKKFGMILANAFLLIGYLLILLCKAPDAGKSNDHQMVQFYAARVLMGVGIGFICCSIGNYQV